MCGDSGENINQGESNMVNSPEQNMQNRSTIDKITLQVIPSGR
jgi:hypothetical protein